MDYKKLNIWLGWLTFAIASFTYLSTMEPTASFWDCGEFIATAYKLEVGHPPGAPLFMILARVFSAFVPVESVPLAVNIISAMASAFTILFLFWSITHLAHKMAIRNGAKLTDGKMIAVLGSGLVGALAYTWSDSFWFSAVEGEVYALSSLFTAVVFWAILKWENEADKAHNLRWIILIAYLMGLSIGVHLLNLLCIPAIAFVYYFRKYEPTTKGVILTAVASIGILGFIQAIIIGGSVNLAGSFEKFFVNTVGLPFNSGTLIYVLLIAGALVAGIIWSHRNGRTVLNTAILSVAVILIGYSTFAMITIRSTANPPIDENNPENVFSLLSYLNREQYGDRPLLMGQFWDSPYTNERKDGKPVYSAVWTVEKNGRPVKTYYDGWSAELFVEENPGHTIKEEYKITDPRKQTEVEYAPEFTMLFPRMYSSQANHESAYKQWSDFKGKPITWRGGGKAQVINRPTFAENMRFFFRYQVGWMYGRYFMWNFAGRQNDIQGHGTITDGNWLSGIDMIDEQRLGSQEFLPSSMTRNKGYNKLFLLPLILGLIGLVYQLWKDVRNWSVVALLFFFTGLAIVIYLNQYPYQPRERDYAYVGSFYAFAIWIGLGVFSLFDAARSMTTKNLGMVAGAIGGLGIVKYLLELSADQPDHSTSFMLLYMGAVAVILLALFGIALKGEDKEKIRAMLATVLCLLVPAIMVAEEWDDHTRAKRETARDMASDYLESCAPNAILFTNGDNDTFPLWYAQEVEGIRTDVRIVNLSLLNTDWYADQMRRKAYESDPIPWTIPAEKYRQGTRDLVALIKEQNPKNVYVDIKRAMKFASDDKNMQNIYSLARKDAYIPSNRFKIPVDPEKVIANGTVSEADSAKIVDVKWEINKNVVLKNHFMVLDLLASFDWERPIYFACTTGPDSYIGLQDHFQLEGLTYRLIPIKTVNDNPNLYGRVGTEIMYENVTEKFMWGNMDADDVYLDENVIRMATNLRLQLNHLAQALIDEGKEEKAREILDLSLQMMPDRNVPFDRLLMPTAEAYYELGDFEKANELTEHLFNIYEENMNYYFSLEPRFLKDIEQEMQIGNMIIQRLYSTAKQNKQDDLADALQGRMETVSQQFQNKMMELQNAGRKTIRGNF